MKNTARIADLRKKLDVAKLALINLGDLDLPEDIDPLSKKAHILNVLDQAERATLRERIFDLHALIELELGSGAMAVKYGKLATESSTQATRCLKQVQSDRLFELEGEQSRRNMRHGKLRAIK